MTAALFVLPLLYLAGALALSLSGRRQGLVVSLGCFAATLVAGAWHISVSRSSTAAIGYLFLPSIAAISGAIALGFGAARRRRGTIARAGGIAALVAAALIPAIEVVAGFQTKGVNARRNVDQRRRDETILRYQREIRDLLARVPERRADTLTALLRARRHDREFVVAVLPEYGIDPSLLDTMAQSPDLGIAYQAVRNTGTDSATLRRVYRSHAYPSYFFQALVAHPRTPPDILREIHNLRPAPISNLEIWFAENPFTPPDVIRDIARTTRDPEVTRRLVRHPAMDCALLRSLETRAGEAVRDDEILAWRLRACSSSAERSSRAAQSGVPGPSNARP